MPQMQLPIFPEGVTHITPELAFMKKDGRVVYFNGHMPVFVHDEHDLRTFRMITSQFIVNGNVKQARIAQVFGLPLITVKRYTKLYRDFQGEEVPGDVCKDDLFKARQIIESIMKGLTNGLFKGFRGIGPLEIQKPGK